MLDNCRLWFTRADGGAQPRERRPGREPVPHDGIRARVRPMTGDYGAPRVECVGVYPRVGDGEFECGGRGSTEPPNPPPSGGGAVVRIELFPIYHLLNACTGPVFTPSDAEGRNDGPRLPRSCQRPGRLGPVSAKLSMKITLVDLRDQLQMSEATTSRPCADATIRSVPRYNGLLAPLGESLRLGRTADSADVAPCRFDASTEPV